LKFAVQVCKLSDMAIVEYICKALPKSCV